MRKNSFLRGFSLVELSIVLVILGLLVGGILAGQSLIRASELRSVGTEYTRWQTAVSAFRDKYFALPGDMSNAQNFWGVATACPGDSTTPSSTAATCNGDGSGNLGLAVSTSNEMYRFWQHLSNAGLVEGSFAGVANSTTPASPDSRLGWNIPASKLGGAGWSLNYLGPRPISSSTWFEGNYGNVFHFGSVVAGNLTSGSILKPEEAWNIDTKLDDGKPGTGSVLVPEGANQCHDTAASTTVAIAVTAAYLLNSTIVGCPLVFKTGTGN